MAALRLRPSFAPVALLLAVALCLAPTTGLAQEESPDDEVDIADELFGDEEISADDLFGDGETSAADRKEREAGKEERRADDFLDEDYAEEEEQQEKGPLYWGFYVPADLLLSRPFALNDTAIGFGFFAAATPVIGIGSGLRSSWDYLKGDGWYFDRGNLQWAWQACVLDPWGYLWKRPLGQLTSEY
jgi:hypothetical protein